jgi:hypothetical protein
MNFHIRMNNRAGSWIIKRILGEKVKKFRFAFELEQEAYETDVLEQTYVRRWITELQRTVDQEVERLTKEYDL